MFSTSDKDSVSLIPIAREQAKIGRRGPNSSNKNSTVFHYNLIQHMLDNAMNLCMAPFSHCSSQFRDKEVVNQHSAPLAIPSEVYLTDTEGKADPLNKTNYKTSVSKNRTFQTIDTTLNSSNQSSREDDNVFDGNDVPKTLIISYSDIENTKSSIEYDSEGNQINLQQSISSISCPSFKNLSTTSSVDYLLDDCEDLGHIDLSCITRESISSRTYGTALPLLESKDSLLSFESSSKSDGTSAVLDLLSFGSEGKDAKSMTDLSHLCEESIQSSYYSERFDESLVISQHHQYHHHR